MNYSIKPLTNNESQIASNNLIIYIPMYNNETTIAELLGRLFNCNYNIKKVIIVNDGSTDKSKQIVESIAIRNDKILLINKKHTGVVETVMEGMIEVMKHIDYASVIIKMDADLEHQPEDVDTLLSMFHDEKCCFVLGYIPYDKRNGTLNHWFQTTIGRKLYLDYCKVDVPQFCSGFYVMDYFLFKKMIKYFELVLKPDMIYLDFLIAHASIFSGNCAYVKVSPIEDKHIKKVGVSKVIQYIMLSGKLRKFLMGKE